MTKEKVYQFNKKRGFKLSSNRKNDKNWKEKSIRNNKSIMRSKNLKFKLQKNNKLLKLHRSKRKLIENKKKMP